MLPLLRLPPYARRTVQPDPLALDRSTAERLLAGRVTPSDAPPAYAPVARVLRAAAAPATPGELAGEEAALAAFAGATRSPHPTHRRSPVLTRLATAKAVAAIVTATLTAGGVVAAATGKLPEPAQRIARQAGGERPAGTSGGPDATGPAKQGLCQAWQSGKGAENGGKESAAAFEALAKAAGGPDKVAAFCAAAGEPGRTGTTAARGPEALPEEAAAGLCRAWAAADPASRARSQAFEALVRAAGGAGRVDAWCRSRAAGSTRATPSTPTAPTTPTTPTTPAGQGRDQGQGQHGGGGDHAPGASPPARG